MNLAAQVLMREWRRRSVVPNLLARPESREIRIEVDMLRNALGIMANFYPGLRELFPQILLVHRCINFLSD